MAEETTSRTFTEIGQDYQRDKNQHLAKFEDGGFLPLINSYLDYYFDEYCKEQGLSFEDTEDGQKTKEEAKEKFKNEVLIPDIKEYYYHMRSTRVRGNKMKRKYFLAMTYEFLIFHGEDKPFTEGTEIDWDIETYRCDENFRKEAEAFWIIEATKWGLSENLSRQ